MDTYLIIFYISLALILVIYIFVFLCILVKIPNNISNFKHGYYAVNNNFKNIPNYYLLTGNRTDMLGSFAQGFIISIIKILYTDENPCIMVNVNKKLFTDWTQFKKISLSLLQDPNSKRYEYDKWKTVGSETMKDHVDARKMLIKNIFPIKINKNIRKFNNIVVKNSERQIKDGMLKHPEVMKFTKSFRETFIAKFLPKEFEDDNFVAIHFRAGDVLKQPKRFKPSSTYEKICKELKKNYSDSKIYVFTSKIPEPDSDDLEVFKKYANNIYQAQNYSTIQCWAIFMHCKVFVMSYSCTSVCPALFRDLNKITYYDKIDRPLPDNNWKYWHK